ncbi:HSP42-like protein [Saccharomyces kudriavzevii IFO 1802]|uniref:HSP42-like protein n=1 Tax=Saccharomyces kudriavzevii (strain ATCC MYA-4449 / AS 2.2408 / CBS 8840 / NBRC 1802 / NCYC 2889) TaxID=226230 RepID=J5RL32_SACK1|nr:HSP42-like protein [Saccharomyces kudriavzevii IFO 1802]
MSFYQPSLSLYDVLNALSSQTDLREQQGLPRQSQRPQRYHPHHGQVHAGGHHPRHHHPLYNRYNGASNAYHYRPPGQAYYYSPEYGYDDEDGEVRTKMGTWWIAVKTMVLKDRKVRGRAALPDNIHRTIIAVLPGTIETTSR